MDKINKIWRWFNWVFLSYISNWLVQNFLSVLTIPLTILTMLVGIYGDILDYNLTQNEEVTKNLTLFFEEEIKIVQSPQVFIPVCSDSVIDTVRHLIIIDRTASTLNEELNGQCKAFRDSVSKDFSTEEIITLKQGVFYVFLKAFSDLSIPIYQKVLCYDGNGEFERDTWLYSDHKATRTSLIHSLKKIATDNYETNQKTDFSDIIREVKNHGKEHKHLNVTIISDFYSENGSISDFEIREIIEENLVKLNLVLVPTYSAKGKEVSNRLLSKLTRLRTDKLRVTFLDVQKILNDNDFDSNSYERIKDRSKEATMRVSNKKKVEFYLPNKSKLNKSYLERDIWFNDSIQKWRVVTKNGAPQGSYSIGDGKFYSLSENWEPWDSDSNENVVKIKLDANNADNSEMYLDFIVDGGNIVRYEMILRRSVPEIISNLAIICIRFIEVLILSMLTLRLFKVYRMASSNKYYTAKRFYSDALIQVFLIAATLVVLFYISNWLLYMITLIVSSITFLFLLIIIVYYSRRDTELI